MKKNQIMNFFQKLSRAFLTPLALIASASLLMGVASFFTSTDIINALPFIGNFAVQYIFKIFLKMGTVVVGNFPVIYAVTLAFALSTEDKEFAAFSGFIGYLAFISGMGMLVENFPEFAARFPGNGITTVFGIKTVNAGMLGGIMVGILTSIIHRRLKHVKLPMAFSFFQGNRFVPLASVFTFVILGNVFPFIWVYISQGISMLANVLGIMGAFGPFLYGMVERLLIPTGLHQIWNTVVRDTAVSGVYKFASGVVIEGQRPAFMNYLVQGLPVNSSLRDLVRFSFGPQIPIMLGALPAIGLAIYQSADKDKRQMIKPLIVTGVVTAMIAGISEPLEFIFLFTAPLLYVAYSVLYGLSWFFMYLLGNQIGFGSGIIEFTVFGLLRSDSRWYICVIVTICEFIANYVLFKWWIKKFNVKTPGRGGDYDNSLALVNEISNINETRQKIEPGISKEQAVTNPKVLKAQVIIKGLGGKENILDVDSCMSRLRVVIKDMSCVDEGILKKTGCSGIIKPDENNIQIVYGTTVGIIKDTVKKELKK